MVKLKYIGDIPIKIKNIPKKIKRGDSFDVSDDAAQNLLVDKSFIRAPKEDKNEIVPPPKKKEIKTNGGKKK